MYSGLFGDPLNVGILEFKVDWGKTVWGFLKIWPVSRLRRNFCYVQLFFAGSRLHTPVYWPARFAYTRLAICLSPVDMDSADRDTV